MIPVTLSTGSVYTYGLARIFALASRAGYDGLELMIDERWDTRQADYLQPLIERYALPILSVHSPFVPRLAGWPDVEVARIERAVALAETLGARVVNLHLPLRARDLEIAVAGRRWRLPMPGATASQREYGAWLVAGGLAAMRAATDVEIVVENLPVRRLLGRRYSPAAMNTWDEIAGFERLCLDTTHCGTTGSDLMAVFERLADGIAHVHLSDYRAGRQHLAVERGELPLARFLETLAMHDYGGIVVVELEPATLPVHDEGELEAELRRNLDFCRRHLGQAG